MLTIKDIERWLEDFDRARRIIGNNTTMSEDDKRDLYGRYNDAMYLITLVESLMVLEEPDGVIERARKRQR